MSVFCPGSWESRCVECGDTRKVIDAKEADLICAGCGLVLEERMVDERPERWAYNDDQGSKNDPSRVGYAPQDGFNMFTPSLGCTIGTTNSLGKRLARLNARVVAAAPLDNGKTRPTRGVLEVMKEFQSVTSSIGVVDHVRHLAEEMFVEFIKAKPTSGTKRRVMAYAACVYYATKQTHKKRTSNEIAKEFGVTGKFSQMCLAVHETLRGRHGWREMFLDRQTTGADVVGRMVYCQPHIMRDKVAQVIRQCEKILEVLKQKKLLMDKNVQGVNVAVIYVACEKEGVGVPSEDVIEACQNAGFAVCRNDFKGSLNTIRAALGEEDDQQQVPKKKQRV